VASQCPHATWIIKLDERLLAAAEEGAKVPSIGNDLPPRGRVAEKRWRKEHRMQLGELAVVILSP
jgi:hypothetical protein